MNTNAIAEQAEGFYTIVELSGLEVKQGMKWAIVDTGTGREINGISRFLDLENAANTAGRMMWSRFQAPAPVVEPITTYRVPDAANGEGLLNVGPGGKTFLACRGTAGGLLPDESPVIVDRAAMLLWMAWATPDTLEEAMTDAELWAGQEVGA